MQQNAQIRRRAGFLLIPVLAATLLAGCGQSKDQADQKVDPKLVDAVVKQLVDSGKLDDAVDKSIQRFVAKQKKERSQAQAKRLEQLNENARKMPAPDPKTDHIKGNVNAPVSMIEYADFECPYCKRFHETPEKVLKKLGNKVNWIYRSMPLSFHGQAAILEAKAGECAARVGGNDTFWKYSSDLFKYTKTNGKGLGDNQTVFTLAKKYGIDNGKFKGCLTDPAIQKRIEATLKSASDLGISGTPTTIVRNNKTGQIQVVVGARPASQVEAAINKVMGDNG